MKIFHLHSCLLNLHEHQNEEDRFFYVFLQMVFAEATSVLPLIASDAFHKGEWKKRTRKNFSKIFG